MPRQMPSAIFASQPALDAHRRPPRGRPTGPATPGPGTGVRPQPAAAEARSVWAPTTPPAGHSRPGLCDPLYSEFGSGTIPAGPHSGGQSSPADLFLEQATGVAGMVATEETQGRHVRALPRVADSDWDERPPCRGQVEPVRRLGTRVRFPSSRCFAPCCRCARRRRGRQGTGRATAIQRAIRAIRERAVRRGGRQR